MTRLFCLHTGQPYSTLALECAKSFAAFGVTVEVIELDSKRDWMSNCMQRSAKILELASQYPNDGIGLLDSDLTCLRFPEKLVLFTGDLAVHDLTDTRPGKSHPCYRYSAGVSVFGATERGRTCLRRWAELCARDEHRSQPLREQIYLYLAIHGGTLGSFSDASTVDGMVVTNLGENYNKVIDFYVPGDETVILHHVASRKLRAVVGGRM